SGDALSLSHLTYVDATITVNFHRLDHPPFPCKKRLHSLGKARKPGSSCIRQAPFEHRTADFVNICSERPLHMKPASIIGFLLILLGIVGFAVGGVSFTHQKKDVDVGPLQISHQQKETIPISPILSTIALLAGAGLVVVGTKSR